MHVTVVDSGSTDGTPDMVEREFPEVRLLRRGNIGFSAANNIVLKNASTPFVLLLNPDTEVRENTIDSSLDRIRSDPSLGMVGCRLITESGELDHACKRSFPTPLGALAHFSGIGRRSGASSRLAQYRATGLEEHEAGEVDAVNGAYMLVRCEALLQVGPLDEGYWLYMEDLDWCRRFWEAGWKVFYEPGGTALHVKGGSSGKRRGMKQEIAFHRGMGRFYRRFEAPSSAPAMNLAVYAGIAAKLMVSLSISFCLTAAKPSRLNRGSIPSAAPEVVHAASQKRHQDQ
jgi:GT2 family glycosyltransferase